MCICKVKGVIFTCSGFWLSTHTYCMHTLVLSVCVKPALSSWGSEKLWQVWAVHWRGCCLAESNSTALRRRSGHLGLTIGANTENKTHRGYPPPQRVTQVPQWAEGWWGTRIGGMEDDCEKRGNRRCWVRSMINIRWVVRGEWTKGGERNICEWRWITETKRGKGSVRNRNDQPTPHI